MSSDITTAVNNGVIVGAKVFEALGILRTRKVLAVTIITPEGEVYNELYGEDASDRDQWDHPFDEISLGKARLSDEHKMSSREIQLLHPALLKSGDIKYWGSVHQDGYTVACSGIQPYFDEAVAKSIMAVMMASLEHAAKNVSETTPGEIAYKF